MDKITIRPAAANDIKGLSRLFYEFHEYHAAGIPDRLNSVGDYDQWYTPEIEKAIQSIMQAENAVLLVAEHADKLVGFVETYLRQDDPANSVRVNRTYAFIQSLVVDGECRRMGIGRKLIAAAHDWAKQKRAQEIRLDAWEFPEGPQSFYENNGYRTLRRTFVYEFNDQ